MKDHSDWYNHGHAEVARRGGDALLRKYQSLPAALEAVYPEYKWQPWLFQKVPVGFWKDDYNIQHYIKWLSEILGIEKMEDWYNVTYSQISQLAGGTLLNQCNFPALLKRCFPSYAWNRRLFATYYKSQDLLRRRVQKIFPFRKDIMTNYKHPQLFFQDTQLTMELDIFIPLISLAFEYQGEYHFNFQTLQGQPTGMQEKDQEKFLACSKIGITLISVPYWWDRSLER